MKQIKSSNTNAELIVFKHLKNSGIYLQKHYKTKEGFSIDIAKPRKRIAVCQAPIKIDA